MEAFVANVQRRHPSLSDTATDDDLPPFVTSYLDNEEVGKLTAMLISSMNELIEPLRGIFFRSYWQHI